MARNRTWFTRLIGYEFNYNGRGIVLDDVFYFEDGNGKNQTTGYAMHYTDTNEPFICDYPSFKLYISQTDYPKR